MIHTIKYNKPSTYTGAFPSGGGNVEGVLFKKTTPSRQINFEVDFPIDVAGNDPATVSSWEMQFGGNITDGVCSIPQFQNLIYRFRNIEHPTTFEVTVEVVCSGTVQCFVGSANPVNVPTTDGTRVTFDVSTEVVDLIDRNSLRFFTLAAATFTYVKVAVKGSTEDASAIVHDTDMTGPNDIIAYDVSWAVDPLEGDIIEFTYDEATGEYTDSEDTAMEDQALPLENCSGRGGFIGEYISTPVHVGRTGDTYQTLQAALDGEITGAGATWESTTPLTGTSTDVNHTKGSNIVNAINGTADFGTEVHPDDMITIGTFDYFVRGIKDDANLLLWAGAPSTMSPALNTGTVSRPSRHTFITHLADDTISKTIPDGVSVQIIGADPSYKLTTLTTNDNFLMGVRASLELSNITVSLIVGAQFIFPTTSMLIDGGLGVIRIGNVSVPDIAEDSSIVYASLAGLFMYGVSGAGFRGNVNADYLLVSYVDMVTNLDTDIFIYSLGTKSINGGVGSQISYDVVFSNYNIHKTDCSTGHRNGCFELNTSDDNKKYLLIDSTILNENCGNSGTADYSIPIWLSDVGAGELTIKNSIVNSDNEIEEIYMRASAGAMTVVYDNSTRLDGSAIRERAENP